MKTEYKIEPSVHNSKMVYRIYKRTPSKVLFWNVKGKWNILREPEGNLVQSSKDRESIKFESLRDAEKYLRIVSTDNEQYLRRIEDFPGVVILADEHGCITKESLDSIVNRFVSSNSHLSMSLSEWLETLDKHL
jgi:hypothetical protein